MDSSKQNERLSRENIYALIGAIIVLIPLGLLAVIKIFANTNMGLPPFTGIMASSDWSIASGMVYLSTLLGLLDATQGRRYDHVRITFKIVLLIVFMLVNFIVYALANIYEGMVFIPWAQGLLFCIALISFIRYQKAFFLIKKGKGQYTSD
ncbi:hypothetical protein L4D76_24900 [Photobacterium sagamiensis]|uniref:hypothetical protein n=1 Tax=Photobacterium sagamiensis TaxID=2910241 RepID=UPI003D12B2DF